jgi:choline monooxygenase
MRKRATSRIFTTSFEEKSELTNVRGLQMNKPLTNLITKEQLAACRAPIDKAATLPRQAFTSEEFFELEAERIFSDGWAAICFSQQVPNPGDLAPLEICGIPLLAVRGQDGELRVFHNITPYDGCLVAIDPAEGQKEIITPYHGWRYDLEGKLTAIPVWDGTWKGNLDSVKDRPRDLAPVRTAIWGPVVFVNITGKAEQFVQFIAPLERALSEWRIGDLDISRDAEGQPLLDPEDLQGNWKTHYENWGINVLHESFVHDIYDRSPEVPRLAADGVRTCDDLIDEGFMALKFEAEKFQNTYSQPPIAHLGHSPETPPSKGYFGSLFPNLHVGALGTMIHFIIGIPVGPGRTKTTRAQFYDREIANNADLAEMREQTLMGLHHAGAEDSRIVEAVQKARRSPAFDSQFYSPFWDAMHHRFTNLVLDALD